MVWGFRIGGLAAAGLALVAGPSMPTPTQSSTGTSADQANAPVVFRLSAEADTDAAEHPLLYRPPVEAEVVDYFRPPAHVGAPGNRGLEYSPEPGLPVQASAEGEVVFAGTVAHNRFVTVQHRDGLRTAYGYLGWIAVAEGDWVTAGQLLGTTSTRFFFSVRAGDTYLDPTLVVTAGHVRLVPHRQPDESRRLAE